MTTRAFISISIDFTGSTDLKKKIVESSKGDQEQTRYMYEQMVQHMAWIEYCFLHHLVGQDIPLLDLFLVKTIGDEFWYLLEVDLDESATFEHRATGIVRALLDTYSKTQEVVLGPLEHLPSQDGDFFSEGPIIRSIFPFKATVDLLEDSVEVNRLRKEFLERRLSSLLRPNVPAPTPVRAGDQEYIDVCNRLGLVATYRAQDRIIQLARTDFIGMHVDRFFRLTKNALPFMVLMGQNLVSHLIFDEVEGKLSQGIMGSIQKYCIRKSLPGSPGSHTTQRLIGYSDTFRLKGIGKYSGTYVTDFLTLTMLLQAKMANVRVWKQVVTYGELRRRGYFSIAHKDRLAW